MGNEFSDQIKKGNIEQPHQRGFSLKSWDKKFGKISRPSSYDQMIFDAGVAFFELFELTRSDLVQVSKKYPPANSQNKVKALCGLSNRNFCCAKADLKHDMDDIRKKADDKIILLSNIRATTNTNNPNKQQFLYDQVANMNIDGVQKALVGALKSQDAGSRKEKLTMEYLLHEAMLSNIYYVLEGWWESILYGVYSYTYDVENKRIHISEKGSEHGYNFTLETLRNDRLNQALLHQIASFPLIDRVGGFKRLQFSGSGKSRRVVESTNKDQIFTMAWMSYKYQSDLLFDTLPKQRITENLNGYEFSISEVLNVFKHLMFLAMDYTERLPQNTDVLSIQSINAFSTKVKLSILGKALSKVTGIKLKTVNEIVNFLTFEGDFNKDIWCHPLVKESEASVYLLVSPLWGPKVLRLVEHWLDFSATDASDKGYLYEDTVASCMRGFFDENPLVGDVKIAKSETLRANGKSEEIDIIILFNDLVLIGEVKCIVTADNARAYGQLMTKLSNGAEQAKRKGVFFQNNLRDLFRSLGWEYSDLLEYSVQPLVIVSNNYGTSRSIADVPVVDLKILGSYFSTNTYSLLATSSKNEILKDEVSMLLYSSFEEASQNFSKFLSRLPQYNGVGSETELFHNIIPLENENYTEIVQTQYKQSKFEGDAMSHDFEKECLFPIVRAE
jgi:hypothetical protein